MAEVENPFQAAQTVDPEVRAYVYSLVTAVSHISAVILLSVGLTGAIAWRQWDRRRWAIHTR